MPRFCPPVFSGISKCLVPTPVLTSECPTCSVCARVYAHTHIHTLQPPVKIEMVQITPLSLFLSKKSPKHQQQVSIDFIGFFYWKQ